MASVVVVLPAISSLYPPSLSFKSPSIAALHLNCTSGRLNANKAVISFINVVILCYLFVVAAVFIPFTFS